MNEQSPSEQTDRSSQGTSKPDVTTASTDVAVIATDQPDVTQITSTNTVEMPEKNQVKKGKRHKNILLYWINWGLLAVIVLAVNFISFSEYWRRDLTQDQRFAASQQTINLLQSSLLRDKPTPARIIFAFQRNTPNYTRMRALLEEYEQYSNGKVEVECIDPLRQPNRAREIGLLYDIEFKNNQVIIDARKDTSHSIHGRVAPIINDEGDQNEQSTHTSSQIEGRQAQELAESAHIRVLNGNNFVVYEQGTTKAVALQMEDMITAALLGALEGTPRKMYLAADKSNFSIELIKDPNSIFSTLNRACRSINIQLVPIRLSGLKAIPTDAAGFMLVGPQYDLTQEEQQVLDTYWKLPSSGIFIALDPHTADHKNLYRFLRTQGLRPQNNRVLLKERGRAFYEINALFAPGLPWMSDFATKSTTLEGESFSMIIDKDDSSLSPRLIALHPLIIATGEYYGETKYASLNPKFDPEEDHEGPLILATAIQRGNTNDINLAKTTSRMIVLGNVDLLAPTTIKQEQRDFIRAALSWIDDREELSGLTSHHDLTLKLNMDSNAVSIFQLIATILLPALAFLFALIIWNTRRH